MKMLMFYLLCMVFTLQACSTAAPSTYELNRRSGLDVAIDHDDSANDATVPPTLSLAKATSKVAKPPRRRPARIEKVWVYDQDIGGNQWLQGTWLFIEIDAGGWLTESSKDTLEDLHVP